MGELTTTDLAVRYGRVEVLHGVSVRAPAGEVTTVVGPNGAGKTTLLSTIAGLLPPSRGTVEFDGNQIHGTSTATLFRRGLALVPQGKHVFASLTVEENLRLAAACFKGSHADEVDKVLELFPRLRERYKLTAALMSGGEQQQLMIARALIARPRFLLMDEPSTGLAPLLVRGVLDVLRRLADEGVGVLLVEQFVHEAVKVSDHVHILAKGEIHHSMTRDEARHALGTGTFFDVYTGRSPAGVSTVAQEAPR